MLWRIINPPSEGQKFPVEDLEHAVGLYNALTASDLLDEGISSNAYGLEIFEDGEWYEWCGSECDDISELAEREYAQEMRVENTIYLEKYPKKP